MAHSSNILVDAQWGTVQKSRTVPVVLISLCNCGQTSGKYCTLVLHISCGSICGDE